MLPDDGANVVLFPPGTGPDAGPSVTMLPDDGAKVVLFPPLATVLTKLSSDLESATYAEQLRLDGMKYFIAQGEMPPQNFGQRVLWRCARHSGTC